MGYPLTIMQQRHPLLRWLLAALLVVSSYTNSGNMSQEFVTCPFNSAHTVSRHRLQNHVEKCKKVIDSTVFSIRLAGLKKKCWCYVLLRAREDRFYFPLNSKARKLSKTSCIKRFHSYFSCDYEALSRISHCLYFLLLNRKHSLWWLAHYLFTDYTKY